MRNTNETTNLQNHFKHLRPGAPTQKIERVCRWIRSGRRNEEKERQVKIGQRGPREEELDKVIHKLNLKQNLAEEAMP